MIKGKGIEKLGSVDSVADHTSQGNVLHMHMDRNAWSVGYRTILQGGVAIVSKHTWCKVIANHWVMKRYCI